MSPHTPGSRTADSPRASWQPSTHTITITSSGVSIKMPEPDALKVAQDILLLCPSAERINAVGWDLYAALKAIIDARIDVIGANLVSRAKQALAQADGASPGQEIR